MLLEREYSLSEIDKMAQLLYEKFKSYKIWTFRGDLGSGKTTLIKSISRYLEVKDIVNSPSFSIIQIYNTSYSRIYHLDLYRLKHFEDVLNIGIEDILLNNDYCFIEWPQVIDPLLKKTPHINIEINNKSNRIRQLHVYSISSISARIG
ncbi:MAG: tRNA (adenosine(37)-N6)-threonylcarbamoyltransferase complex ATPase subunit type 1 TsaE [Chitinophagaceae bacterium]